MVHAYEQIDAWRAARRRAERMLLALDFDGTLAPIVARPDDAALLPEARAALERLVRRADTTIALVSGRALADVRSRAPLPNAHYAGNHGLEIEGPGVHRIHPEAADSAPALAACVRALRQEFADEEAVLIEDKTLTLSVHFRLVADEAREQAIRDRVARCCGGHAGLRLTAGKKVVEIRPDVPWDKGRATRFLVDTLLADAPAAPVLYIGDDRTDEDAFRALGERPGGGLGIRVADEPAPTRADYSVASPGEVAVLLERLREAAGG